MKWMITLSFVLSTPGLLMAAPTHASMVVNLEKQCAAASESPAGARSCEGPAGYEALIFATPMGEQLTLQNVAIAFSAAVIRCERGQKITQLVWRMVDGKPFAAVVGYRCAVGTRGQSAKGAAEKLLVQGLKGFEKYGHEVSPRDAAPTMKMAEQLADGWLKAQ